MSNSDITVIDQLNDYTTLAANLTIIGSGPTGKFLLTLGKFTGSFLPLGALQEGDKRLKHAFELLYDMKEIMDIKTHDELHNTYEAIVIARNDMDFSAKRFTNPKSLYRMISKIYIHRTESIKLDKDVVRSSQVARNAHMRNVKQGRKQGTETGAFQQSAAGASSSSTLNCKAQASHTTAVGNQDSASSTRAPSSPAGSNLRRLDGLHFYLASPNQDPFGDSQSQTLVLSEVDLRTVGQNEPLEAILIPRNIEEEAVLHSMPFQEAFPGRIH